MFQIKKIQIQEVQYNMTKLLQLRIQINNYNL